MLSGIGSYNGYSGYLQNQAMGRADPSEMFNTTDTDGSGGISQTELEDWIGAMAENTGTSIDTTDAVSTYDSDGDEELSEEELQSFMRDTLPPPQGMMGMGPFDPAEGLFQALDTDGNSGISETELSNWVEAMSEETGNTIDASSALDEYDLDGDGELGSTELESFLTANGIGAPSGADEAAGSPPGGVSSGSSASAISEYDTNGDGVLSSEELQAYLDDLEENSSTPHKQESISNYSMNLENSGTFDPQDVFMKLGGTGAYSPIDIEG